MGSTMFKGCSLQEILQLNQIQLPKPHNKNYFKIIQYYNNLDIQQYQMYKDTIISNPRAKHAPSGFNPIWTAFTGNLTTQALKDTASDASPSGILNTCLPTPHNDCLGYKIFNEA
jgi:hypothetical protein